MSTLLKFQRLRASLKTTKKNRTIVSSFKLRNAKYRNSTQPHREKIPVKKKTKKQRTKRIKKFKKIQSSQIH